ncbi:MAG TPA: glycerol-3-phosphate acyltransferase [Candidatus Kapabacteria bacterium]|nr:glycerol-3-phosphate acyltransferase [Candidatus Kapabacteria bacterium]
MLDITLGFILSYLIGSFPTAYLVMRASGGGDLRTEGSGNIGARNAYEVSGKKLIGIVVLVIDVAKGALPTLYLTSHPERIYLLPYVIVGLVLGHCYSIWIKFHGGRGLATAAGILSIVGPIFIAVWLIFYAFSMLVRKNVHLQAFLATFGAMLIELILYADHISLVYLPMTGQIFVVQVHYAIIVIAAIVISRFIGPANEEFKNIRDRQRA